jgi:hypothetical protein
MKTSFSLFSRSRLSAVLLLAGTVGGPSVILHAADATPPPAAPSLVVADRPTRGEIKEMDAFLDKHAVIDDELRNHPALADSPDFLAAHPEYAAFVAANPGIADQLKTHPRYFMHRALAVQRKQPITEDEVQKLDAFLDNHPDIAKALAADPRLIDDPKYIEAHPELHKFLNDHPRVSGALESKPNATMKREEHRATK